MRRSRSAVVLVVLGLAGALVGVVPDGAAAVLARKECRSTAFVTNVANGTVSTIDVNTRAKNSADIPVGPLPAGQAITPIGRPSSLLSGTATRSRRST
jgi:YVTN family beta-propeller protein